MLPTRPLAGGSPSQCRLTELNDEQHIPLAFIHKMHCFDNVVALDNLKMAEAMRVGQFEFERGASSAVANEGWCGVVMCCLL